MSNDFPDSVFSSEQESQAVLPQSEHGGRGGSDSRRDRRRPWDIYRLKASSAAYTGRVNAEGRSISAALIGLVIAFVGTFASTKLQMPIADGVASIGIAVVLGITGFVLARESKALLIGEAASDPVNQSIRVIVEGVAGVVRVNRLTTVHLAPDEVVVSLGWQSIGNKLTFGRDRPAVFSVIRKDMVEAKNITAVAAVLAQLP